MLMGVEGNNKDNLTSDDLVRYVTDRVEATLIRRMVARERTAQYIGRGMAWIGFWLGAGIFLASTW
jgi:hypothetical protein